MTKTKQCSKCGSTNLITSFYKRTTSKDGYSGRCKECEKSSTNTHYAKNSNIIKKKHKSYKTTVKLQLVDYKGGKCSICGYNKSLVALDFHHVTDNKEFDITKGIVNHYSIDRLKTEINKCILVCSNCHREIHYGDGIND